MRKRDGEQENKNEKHTGSNTSGISFDETISTLGKLASATVLRYVKFDRILVESASSQRLCHFLSTEAYGVNEAAGIPSATPDIRAPSSPISRKMSWYTVACVTFASPQVKVKIDTRKSTYCQCLLLNNVIGHSSASMALFLTSNGAEKKRDMLIGDVVAFCNAQLEACFSTTEFSSRLEQDGVPFGLMSFAFHIDSPSKNFIKLGHIPIKFCAGSPVAKSSAQCSVPFLHSSAHHIACVSRHSDSFSIFSRTVYL